MCYEVLFQVNGEMADPVFEQKFQLDKIHQFMPQKDTTRRQFTWLLRYFKSQCKLQIKDRNVVMQYVYI